MFSENISGNASTAVYFTNIKVLEKQERKILIIAD